MFRNLFSFSDEKKSAHRLYIILVEQARQPAFYLNCGVADTVAGRFDMVILHAILLLRRMHREPEKTGPLSQALFDYMFDDFDLNLREIGIGDTGIGKRIKKMGTGFYGRLEAYGQGLDSDDDTLLHAALARNLYREMQPSDQEISSVANYMRRESAALEKIDLDSVMAGNFNFGDAPT